MISMGKLWYDYGMAWDDYAKTMVCLLDDYSKTMA